MLRREFERDQLRYRRQVGALESEQREETLAIGLQERGRLGKRELTRRDKEFCYPPRWGNGNLRQNRTASITIKECSHKKGRLTISDFISRFNDGFCVNNNLLDSVDRNDLCRTIRCATMIDETTK